MRTGQIDMGFHVESFKEEYGMKKMVRLKDGTQVLIRPLTVDDLDRSFGFFKGLPKEDRVLLRVDVTQRDLVEERIRMIETGNVKRLVAVVDDKIIADGAMELSGHGWAEHVAEIRMIVSREYQRKGLGHLMARELHALAASARVEVIVCLMMRPQKVAQSIMRKLGFREEVLLPDWVKDVGGQSQDLVVMRCDLKVMWQELEEYFHHTDWQRAR